MYLEIDEGFSGHRKTVRLCGLMQNTEADTYPIRLWQWAVRSAPDGDLTGMEPYDLEIILRYRQLDGKLYAALVKAGFIDELESGDKRIHNWEKRTGAAIDRMATKAQNLQQRRLHASNRCSPGLCPTCAGTDPARSSDKPATSPVCTGDDPPRPVQSSPVQTSLRTETDVPETGNAAPADELRRGRRRRTAKKPPPLYKAEFERIWESTGRSGNKLPAFIAWLDNGEPSSDDVCAGWRHAQRHDRRWQGKDPHVPHLATWINARGWEDRPTNGTGSAARAMSPAEQIQAIQAKEREDREARRRSDEGAEEVAALVQAALREVATP